MTTEKKFVKIKEACLLTGLSQYYLRNGCRDGSIPCVMSGPVYMINLPALLRKLDAESEGKR